ncbi:hypothetical protein B4123_2102 [Bacillus paralicheniformis]|nr:MULTISPECIES: hypothetical protein [Bacillus]MDE1382094.1 hypothetical protein [Bacillus paralicheniformis]MDE1390180.1 hypothetical protein [Bacillus paralicheniformis]MED0804954.1 hypothetical protein [Bacillus paralicheniformis]OLG11465.1 hypothetical protein B4123_2102 [Bacillus paralicheniformis]TWJ59813.1 hypothetical protein CHCC5023_4467 [Bacillus paralicheniformis]
MSAEQLSFLSSIKELKRYKALEVQLENRWEREAAGTIKISPN